MTGKKILAFAMLFVAVLSLVFSIMCFTMDTGNMYGGTESSESYGGDAYTGIQNAAAQTATNTYHMGNVLEDLGECVGRIAGFAFLLAFFTFAAVGVSNLLGDKEIKLPAQFGIAPAAIDNSATTSETVESDAPAATAFPAE